MNYRVLGKTGLKVSPEKSSDKFLPCQLKKKYAHSILILYLC